MPLFKNILGEISWNVVWGFVYNQYLELTHPNCDMTASHLYFYNLISVSESNMFNINK